MEKSLNTPVKALEVHSLGIIFGYFIFHQLYIMMFRSTSNINYVEDLSHREEKRNEYSVHTSKAESGDL